MTLEVFPTESPEPRLLFRDFIKNLRRHTKQSIISTGLNLLWTTYKSPSDGNIDAKRHLLYAFGLQLISLALARASEHRSLDLTLDGFHYLCNQYLAIPDSISDQAFLKWETEEIFKLLNADNSEDRIPDTYLKLDILRENAANLFIMRNVRMQHSSLDATIQELNRAYHVFITLDAENSGRASSVCKQVFQIEPRDFVRSGFGLFALANEDGKNGYINFRDMKFDKGLLDTWNIDPGTCQLTASKISYPESKFLDWYCADVQTQHLLYRKFVPSPLSQKPIIYCDRAGKDMDFILPSPRHYLRGFTNAMFSPLFQNDEKLKDSFGTVIEDHIGDALKHIFGFTRVSKIEGDRKKADFHIHLDECDIIIEIKKSLGGEDAQSVMMPSHIADIWRKLYRACKQCAASMQDHKKPNRPIIALVIIAEHITLEASPFQLFAERTGLFRDLNIQYIEFISWNSLELTLSRTSIKNYASSLVEKWKKKGTGMTFSEVLNTKYIRDTPAHAYEYFRQAEKEIFGKNFIEPANN